MPNYITDEIKAMIGLRSDPEVAYHAVEASEVRRFFQAIMDPKPRYWDADWAKASRYGGLVAPPAFPTFAFRYAPNDTDPLDRMKVEHDWDGLPRSHRGLPPVPVPASLPRLLNGGYEYEFYRYAKIGERIWRSATYRDIYQRDGRSGTMVFVITEQLFTTDNNVKLIKATTTTILR